VHVIKEFGELIQRWEQHDNYVREVKRLSKDLLHECESRARELGVTKIDTIEEFLHYIITRQFLNCRLCYFASDTKYSWQ
jgi:hypothetical protein